MNFSFFAVSPSAAAASSFFSLTRNASRMNADAEKKIPQIISQLMNLFVSAQHFCLKKKTLLLSQTDRFIVLLLLLLLKKKINKTRVLMEKNRFFFSSAFCMCNFSLFFFNVINLFIYTTLHLISIVKTVCRLLSCSCCINNFYCL